MVFKNKFTLGADPELFLVRAADNVPVSAIDIIPGTKEYPHRISKKGHSVQVDNVLLEFNIPPSENSKEMYENIRFVTDWFDQNLPKDLKWMVKSSMFYNEDQLDHPKACEFGCDPDFDAWREQMNEPPECENKTLRSAGGHIHISYENHNIDTSVKLIRALDLFLGVPSILIDTDTERRKLYGKAGCFRLKRYGKGKGGVEYRTLSNFWVQDQRYMDFIYNGVDRAFTYINENDMIPYDSELGISIREAINNNNTVEARNLVEKFEIIY